MAEEDNTTLTSDAGSEDLDQSQDTTNVNDNADLDGATKDSAAEGDDSSNAGDEDNGSDESEGEDKTPTKKDNQSGYLLRQLSTGNPNMQRLKATLQPWADAGENPLEIKDRQRDINDYIRDASITHENLQRDAEQVQKEIPMFNPADEANFDQVKYRRALGQFSRDMAIADENGATDVNGNPIIVATRMRLIDYMREKAEDYALGSNASTSSPGKAVKSPSKSDKSKIAKAKMDNAADTAGGSSNAGSKSKDSEDPFLAGFDDPYGRHAVKNAHAFSKND